MIHLGFLLHLHQPPDQFEETLERVATECYRPLLDLLLARPEVRFTLNLTWSLTERWIEQGHYDCIDRIRTLLDRQQVEVTGTAAYHPILPLIGADEMRRQITLNAERHREIFGMSWAPRGFFPPELAYGHELPPVLQELGYSWCLAEDIPYVCLHEQPPCDFVPVCADFAVLLRSSLWSNAITLLKHPQGRHYSGTEIASGILHGCQSWFGDRDGYMILAMDAETFGHHVRGHIEGFMVPFLDYVERHRHLIRLVGISEIVDRFPRASAEVPPGSWSTSVDDFWQGDFFPLWKGKYNQAHHLMWELTELAVSSIDRLQAKLDRSLDSSTFHAARQTRSLPELTARGVDVLMEVIAAAAPDEIPRAEGLKARLVQYVQGA